jgi:hypothetical protein
MLYELNIVGNAFLIRGLNRGWGLNEFYPKFSRSIYYT